MGFRTPPSSLAAAVDTGHGPADPGVRVLTDTTYPGTPQGIVEWRTGLMTTNARATLSGGVGGSSFSISGGATAGGTAPELDLNVESAPTSGYRAVARLKGADLFLIGAAQAATVGAVWTADLTNGTYNAAGPSGTYAALPFTSPTIAVPAGYVLDVEFRAPAVFVSAGGELAIRLKIGGTVADGLDIVNPSTGTLRIPIRLADSAAAAATDRSLPVVVEAWAVTGSSSIQASAGAPVVLRHLLR